MTKKQFEWLKCHQPLEIDYIYPYEEKKPKDFHYLHTYLDITFGKEDITYSGYYFTFNGRVNIQHYAKYIIHYKNIRELRYRKKPDEKYC